MLQWIADDCPEDVIEGHAWKVTAIALRSRGLVKISKRGGWTSTITGTGRFYLAHGKYAPTPASASFSEEPPATSDQETAVTRLPPAAAKASAQSAPVQPRHRPSALPKKLTSTEQLFADLAAHDGEIQIPYREEGKYELKVRAAMRTDKVPAGKQVVFERRYGSEGVVRLVDAPAWAMLTPDPVPVARSTRNPHPAVVILKSSDSPLKLDRPVIQRALIVVQSLVVEAERRGHTVSVPKIVRVWNGWTQRLR